jgi:hypothetical protein
MEKTPRPEISGLLIKLDEECKPFADPLLPNRAGHLRIVRGQTPAARAAACGVSPLATCMTTRSRLIGVRRALFIRSSSGTLKLCNLSFLDPDPMDNLWKAHI